MKQITPDMLKNIWGRNCTGVLGMIFAPGRNKPHQPHIKRQLLEDLTHLKNLYGTQTIVSLLQQKQMKQMNIQDQSKLCQNFGIKFMQCPILDRSVPHTKNEIQLFKRTVKNIVDQQIKMYNKVVIAHCKAGLGRTGLFAASCLLYSGFDLDKAITQVRKVRPGTIQVPQQLQFLKNIRFQN